MRIQKKTRQRKLNFSARGIEKIRKAIEKDSRMFKVSKSFVICVILAQHYGINEQEPI